MSNRTLWISLRLVIFCVLLLITYPQFIQANESEVRLIYNGTNIADPNIEVINQRIFVTVEIFANHYGFPYSWDDKEEKLIINGVEITTNYGKPRMKGDHLTASIRAMIESLAEGRMSVQWKGALSYVVVEQDALPVVQQPAKPLSVEQKSANWKIALILLTFISTILLYWLIVLVKSEFGSDKEKRLRKYISTPYTESKETRETSKQGPRPKNRVIVAIGQLFKNSSVKNKWELELDQAGMKIKPEEFMAIRLLVAFFIGAIFYIAGSHWLLVVLLMLIGFWIPVIYMRRKRAKRLARCSAQLSNALSAMANSLRSGFSFMQALQFVGKEIPDPLGPEINRTIREVNFGVDIEEAFAKLVIRLPDRDLDLVVHSLMIQRQTGGNLAELLETLQETIRERLRLKDELRALTAQGRLSAWVISLLPVFMGLILNLMSPDYFGPMLNHPLGWFLLGLGSLMGLMGWFLIQKIVKIEV